MDVLTVAQPPIVSPDRSNVLSGWLPPLDGIRGLAVVMVIMFHGSVGLARHNLLERALYSVFGLGWTGVDLFFVLSGFLITGILMNSREAENYFSSFYMRRILRIFPVYYLSLAVVFVLLPLIAPNDMPPIASGLERAGYLFYAQNWIHRTAFALTGHYWSLAVEEQFYLIWPLIIASFAPKRILQIIIGACAFSILLRFALIAQKADLQTIIWNTFARMDSLLIGAACSIALQSRPVVERLRRYTWWLWCMPVITLGGLRLISGPFDQTVPLVQGIGFTIIALSYAGFIVAAVLTMGSRSMIQQFLTSRFMRGLGKYSYAAYIWHVAVGRFTWWCELTLLHRGLPPLVNIPLVLLITLAVSMCTYALVERPILTFKRYFEPRWRPRVANAV
jgi:peptidoglycan/LPS O-acetylase OafA/YrhL